MKSYESTLPFLSSCRQRMLSSMLLHSSIVVVVFLIVLLPPVSHAQGKTSESTDRPLSSPFFYPFATTKHSLFQSTMDFDHTLNQSSTASNRFNFTPRRSPAHLTLIILICSVMCIFTIFGNLVVIISVCLVRKLQTASNILIVSLAVSDILVGLFIMPLAMVLEITDHVWILGSIMCDIWTSTDVLLCTSSILNFLFISIDRYCIINHPFKYAPMRKVKLLSLMITMVWVFSALVSLPPILGWGRPSENLPTCQVNGKLDYQIFATMLSFYIPLILVLIIYANIYRTAQTAMDTRSSVQMSQFLTHNNSANNIAPAAVAATAPAQTNGTNASSPHLYLNVSQGQMKDDNSSISTVGKRTSSKQRSTNNINRSHSSGFFSPSRCLGRRLSTPLSGRFSSMFGPRRQTFFRHVHMPNQKVIRTLGVILGTFIVCWLPFMAFAIIKPLHDYITRLTGSPRTLNVPPWVESVLLWFGYSSSMLNPLIYSKFNREFRLPFREIICCRCRGLNEKIRRQEFLDNVYGDTPIQARTGSTHLHATVTPLRNSSNPEAVV